MEYKNFTYGSNQNDLGVVGHYTQMVGSKKNSNKLLINFGYSKIPILIAQPHKVIKMLDNFQFMTE